MADSPAPSAVLPAARCRRTDGLFLLSGGLLGSLFGGLHDAVVSYPLSPEYFAIGKELAADEWLHARALGLGLQAGVGPGVLAAAVLLYLGRRPRDVPAFDHCRLVRYFGFPLLAAVAVECAFALAFSANDPFRFRYVLEELHLDAGQIDRFLLVWWLHVGLYAGFGAGLVVAGYSVARRRRAWRAPTTAPQPQDSEGRTSRRGY